MQTSDDAQTQEALALLELPAIDSISEAQVRGKACVWCAGTLTAATAVDLGPRRKPVLDSNYEWYPRGCNSCTGPHALLALHNHAPRCEPCVINAAECEIGMVLLRLIREGNRTARIEPLVQLTRGARSALSCEPCLTAKIFGGEHKCTTSECPCCGTAS